MARECGRLPWYWRRVLETLDVSVPSGDMSLWVFLNGVLVSCLVSRLRSRN